jgi:hypothetical protein
VRDSETAHPHARWHPCEADDTRRAARPASSPRHPPAEQRSIPRGRMPSRASWPAYHAPRGLARGVGRNRAAVGERVASAIPHARRACH